MKNKKAVLIGFIFLIMISIALAENFRGIFMPEFKRQFAIDDTSIGIMDSLGTLAYLLFTFIGSLLCEKFGQKKVFILGLSIMVCSMFMYFLTFNVYMLFANIFVLNIGLSITSIAINTIVPILSIGFQAVLMNLTHFCYGLGASTAPIIGGVLLSRGVLWNKIYFATAILFIIILMTFMFVKVPEVHKTSDKEKSKKISVDDKLLVILITIGLGFYVFAEVGTGTWFVNYLKENYKFDAKTSGFYMSLFFGMLTIGRLTGGFIVEKIGYLKSINIYLSTAFILYLLGIIIGNSAVILVAISGFFFSIVYPTTLVCISKIFKSNTSAITGIIVTFSSLVRMVLSLGFGKANDIMGSSAAYYILPCCLLIALMFMSIVYIKTRKIFNEVGEN